LLTNQSINPPHQTVQHHLPIYRFFHDPTRDARGRGTAVDRRNFG
jgi:hypothetical protein